MRVAIYIRVSTLDQAREGYSLAAQRAALERWAAERGHEAASLLANNSITFRDNSQEKNVTKCVDKQTRKCYYKDGHRT